MVNVSYSESAHTLNGDNLLQDRFSTADRENFLKYVYQAKRTTRDRQLHNTTRFSPPRACYVVEGDIRTLGPYLVDIAFDRNVDDSKPINVRLRALRCLFSVTPEDVLEQVIGNTIEKLRYVLARSPRQH